MTASSTTQRCYRCDEVKPIEAFAWRRRANGQRDTFCRPCRSAYGKEHYAANRQRYIDQAGKKNRELRLERTAYLISYFEIHPCADCGESDPLVLEFDHLGAKLFNVGGELVNRSWQSILDEMSKCEVVCANCHRRRTSRRQGSVRARLAT